MMHENGIHGSNPEENKVESNGVPQPTVESPVASRINSSDTNGNGGFAGAPAIPAGTSVQETEQTVTAESASDTAYQAVSSESAVSERVHPVRLYRIAAFMLGLLLMAGTVLALQRLFFSSATKVELTLYFSDFSRSRLVPVQRTVPVHKGRRALLYKAIQELCFGPVSNDTLPTVPQGTRLLAVWLKGDTAYVDFSRELYLGLSVHGGSEVLAVYSVVQTAVGNVTGIHRVQILVNGNPLPVLRGLVSLSAPLAPRPDLVYSSIRNGK